MRYLNRLPILVWEPRQVFNKKKLTIFALTIWFFQSILSISISNKSQWTVRFGITATTWLRRVSNVSFNDASAFDFDILVTFKISSKIDRFRSMSFSCLACLENTVTLTIGNRSCENARSISAPCKIGILLIRCSYMQAGNMHIRYHCSE